jgi:spiro-SPASM protein
LAKVLHSLFPDHVYAQAVRMKQNEDPLEAFYRHWEGETGRVIVQKYDSFGGYLPDHKVTDLSPLKRFPCWHIKRDLSVLMDGRVPMCREDLQAQTVLGNIFEDDLSEIWARGEPIYSEHLNGSFRSLCDGCDEYYTYNF